jgi:hypothetical protein
MVRVVGFAAGSFILGADAAGDDTTPDAFDTFTDQFNVPTTTVRTSNSVTPVGYDAAAAISVSGGDSEYSIDGAAFTNAGGTINPGSSIRVRHTSSGVASTTVTTTVTIGGVAATFESTTAGAGGTASLAPVIAIIRRRQLLS